MSLFCPLRYHRARTACDITSALHELCPLFRAQHDSILPASVLTRLLGLGWFGVIPLCPTSVAALCAAWRPLRDDAQVDAHTADP